MYGIDNNEDKIKFNINSKKNIYNFNATIYFNKNRLVFNEIDYVKIQKHLPKSVVPAYDGMSFLI